MSNNISQAFLAEIDQEIAVTRKMLERVPEDKPDFRPHEKSMTLARLAAHVAEMPEWAVMTLTHDEMNFDPTGFTPRQMTSRKEMLTRFDADVTKMRDALAGTADDKMMRTWTLKVAGQTMMSMPRVAVMRSMVINHMIHHRAQLGVYLRMNNIPVPGAYGPSADDAPPA
jgi:uncharacterized damage-inducible protein DinB